MLSQDDWGFEAPGGDNQMRRSRKTVVVGAIVILMAIVLLVPNINVLKNEVQNVLAWNAAAEGFCDSATGRWWVEIDVENTSPLEGIHMDVSPAQTGFFTSPEDKGISWSATFSWDDSWEIIPDEGVIENCLEKQTSPDEGEEEEGEKTPLPNVEQSAQTEEKTQVQYVEGPSFCYTSIDLTGLYVTNLGGVQTKPTTSGWELSVLSPNYEGKIVLSNGTVLYKNGQSCEPVSTPESPDFVWNQGPAEGPVAEVTGVIIIPAVDGVAIGFSIPTVDAKIVDGGINQAVGQAACLGLTCGMHTPAAPAVRSSLKIGDLVQMNGVWYEVSEILRYVPQGEVNGIIAGRPALVMCDIDQAGHWDGNWIAILELA